MSYTTMNTYTIPSMALVIRDHADEIYKMFLRKLVAYETNPEPTVQDDEAIQKLFGEVIKAKRERQDARSFNHAG